MAKNKNGGNGGTSGDGGAPAEAHAPDAQQPESSALERPEPATITQADIPPDQQEPRKDPAVNLGTMSLDELKAAQEVAHWAVKAAEKRLAESIAAERALEHERCLRYQAKAKEQGKRRAIVVIDGKRMTIKKRSNSDLLMFVGAEVEDAIEA